MDNFGGKKFWRLLAGFSVIILMMIVLGVFSFQKTRSLAEQTTLLYTHPLTVSNTVLKINATIISMHRYMKDVTLARNLEQLKVAVFKVQDNEQTILQLYSVLLDRFLGDKSKINEAYESFINWALIRTEVIGLTRAGEREKAAEMTKGKGAIYVKSLTAQMQGLIDFTNKKAAEFLLKSQQQYNDFKNLMILLMTTTVGISGFVAAFTISSVNKADNKQKWAEQELQKSYASLEAKVEARTRELTLSNDKIKRQSIILENVERLTQTGGWVIDVATMELKWSAETYHIHEVPVSYKPTIETAIKFYVSESQPLLQRAINAALNDGQPWDLELELMTAKGSRIQIRTLGEAIIKNGHVSTLMGTFQNITAQKFVENELRKARMSAEKANVAKSEFLASMSHDLRTPLNAIMGFSDIMRTKIYGPLGDDRYESYATDIYNSGALLISLINDVLDLSKVEAGKYQLSEDRVEIDPLLQNSFHLLGNMADNANIILVKKLPLHLPPIIGDERALTQILNNLLSNAIKFTANGGTVSVDVFIDDKNQINVHVCDSGIGMDKIGIDKALRPFEQADGYISKQHKGTGLGLHLCQNYMHLFNGELNIESEKDVGTTVKLTFPATRTGAVGL